MCRTGLIMCPRKTKNLDSCDEDGGDDEDDEDELLFDRQSII